MTPDDLRHRVLQSVAASQRLLGHHGPGGYVEEGDGWVAAVLPSLAEATLVNGLVVLDPAALPDALALMSAIYANAGVRRWGVLLDPAPHLRRELQAHGLVRDALPFAMAAPLAGMNLDATTDGPTITRPDYATVGRVNDQAYGHPDDRMEDLIAGFPPGVAHTYGVAYADEIASVAMVSDHDGDATVGFVATLPWAQHQGLASRVLNRALEDARQRGLTTTTLIASHAGRSLYTALGYQDVGTLELWEHRSP